MSSIVSETDSVPSSLGTSSGLRPSILKVALIGVTGFARVHYEMVMGAIQEGASLQLVAAAVINQEEVPLECQQIREVGGALYDDVYSMLEAFKGDIDLCFIPVGIHLHAPMTIAALQAGANVFVEKPAAATIQDVRAMQAAERETGRFVAVGFQTMFASETLWMKDAILSGRIGAVQSIKCRCLWPRLDTYYTRNDWAGRLRVGDDWVLDSPFNNAVSHQLNMICFLAGESRERAADIDTVEAELYRAHRIESADTACLRVQTKTGLPLYFYATHCSEAHLDPEIVIRGESGEIRWTFTDVTLTSDEGTVETRACEADVSVRSQLLDRLLNRMENSDVFICDLEVAAAHTLSVNGAHESSPVHDIPADLISHESVDGGVKTTVSGLDDLIHRAFEQEVLFSEMDVPWAQAGALTSTNTAYDYFPQRVGLS
ncbi:Gfo/Idh/MocA family oxidoreductase [Coraliomargarita sp. SDUM461003]|uniref:Gfo/Idh/MocA family oxidoreductase n=1 Tax=Thalassobacterium maritimum TaxID=3041265 RepID=A0ABU1AX60_9BACT|nr:Gfo/Idh/MocA family oxidoreductase [Coraliomargarita sp. SDUM461003]MDQ8208737.1 Gfo/Idh/MocA family oxidoreductase [Coraliomargarita sp. SDUM461003]